MIPLIEKLKVRDYNGMTAESAAEALGNIGDERAIEPLTALLLGKIGTLVYTSPQIEAAIALGKIGHSSEVKPLIYKLTDSDKYVQESAANALLALVRDGRLNEEAKQLVATYQARADWPL